MSVVQSDGAVRTVATGSFVDAKFSADGSLLYAVSGNTISVIDAATGDVITHYTAGTKLGALDISADGHYLAVVDQQPDTTATLFRIDLTDGTVASYSTPVSEGYFYDVAFLADGTALVSQQGTTSAGMYPLRLLDFGTGQFSVAGGSMSQGANLGAATLTTSSDHSQVLIEPFGYALASYVYESGTGFVAYTMSGTTDPYASPSLPPTGSGVQATSPTGDLHVQGLTLNIYDGSLHLLGSLRTDNPFLGDPDGLAFSADGQRLYVGTQGGHYLVVFDVATWQAIGTYPVGAEVANARDSVDNITLGYGDIVNASPDGHYLSVIGTNGVQLIDLTQAQFQSTTGDDTIAGPGPLYGLAGNDDLSDGGVVNAMYGGPGDDVYHVTNANAQAVEFAGQGHDIVYSSVSYELGTNLEDLTLVGSGNISGYGNGVDNLLVGNDGDNVLWGAAGNDHISGGDGNDRLDGGFGDDVLDGGAGYDVADYTSASGPVSVSLAVSGPQNTGGAGTDTLISIEHLKGSQFADHLTGDGGDNNLDGGLGDDTMAGGGGNDVYVVDSASDVVVEAADQGTDEVWAGVTYTLGANVENLTLLGAANINGTGNSLANVITGNFGNNLLDGGGGADTMRGGYGDDTYVVDSWDDQVFEDTNAGTDTVRASISYVLTSDIENLVLTGTRQISGTGSFYDNTITANDAGNHLYGGAGNDVLIGGAGDDLLSGDSGTDILTGGGGNDTFLLRIGEAGPDTITDFGIGDRILISGATLDGFTFDLSGNVLTFSGGGAVLNFAPFAPTGALVASAAAEGGVELTAISHVVHNNFNGDGHGDLMWRDDSGQFTNWLGSDNGNFTENGGNAYANVSSDWHIVGTGDFNGEGRSDILWRNDDGQLTTWYGWQSGGFGTGPSASVHVATDWKVAGVGDFNGDGRSDILWRQDGTGWLTDWLGADLLTGDGSSFTPNGANFSTGVATDWSVVATGDFNRDGFADILWRHDGGQLTDWLGTATGGFTENSANFSEFVATDWKVAATGDFNGDGFTDILWRQDGTGWLTDWLGTANGAFTPNGANFSTGVATDWQVAAIGDFDGDSKDDILWRQDGTGWMTNWLGTSSGAFAENSANFSTGAPTSWHVVDPLL